VRDAYDEWQADSIVVESNYGGDLVTSNVQGASDRHFPVEDVNATRGKDVRAEPVASLYGDPDVDWEDAKVRHAGSFSTLESQLTTWVPGDADSPDRLDALVWVFHDLMLQETSEAGVIIV
jgi:phage terminase large subunit-like protein